MKLTIFLSMICISSVWGVNLNSQNTKVLLSTKNMQLKNVIEAVEKQTDYLFIYNEDIDLSKEISINMSNKTVTDILPKMFANTNVEYAIEGKYIILYNKKLAQNDEKRKITGVVTDGSNEPLVGARIGVKDTKEGTISDLDGKFSLEVDPKSTIFISYVGFISQEIAIGSKTNFVVSLKVDTKLLDQVVVIGYGTTSTRKIASSVTAIKGEKLQDLPYNNITASLQGRATGVIIQQSGGEPGSIPSISIRGGGAPVYVIDGIISTSWDFNTLNSFDIESLSILKDAASLAVYGSRAANGIVLVKTKQGGKGKTSVTYSFNAEYSEPTKLAKKIDSYTYAELQNSAAENDGNPSFHIYDEETMAIIRDQTDPYRFANTDWLGLGLNSFAPQYKHSLSLSGSGQLVNYYLSLGMLDQGSLFSSNALDYKRYTLRSNINTTFDEIGLRIGLNVNAAMEKKDFPSFSSSDIWGHLYESRPIIPAFNSDGTYSSATDHPLVEMDKRSGYYRNNGNFTNVQLTADWDAPWVNGLTIGTMFHYRVNNSHVKKFSNKAPQFYPDGSVYPIAKASLSESGYFGESYNIEVSAGYLKEIDNAHTIDAKMVFTAAENEGHNFSASRKNYISSAVDQLFAGSQEGLGNSGNSDEGGRLGWVGRLRYDYKNRYIIDGSFRYDGSDNFAKEKRWGFFPSAAVAWALSEEPFFKSLNLSTVDLIKFRASYGQTGTEDGVNRFGYLSPYGLDEKIITIGGKLQEGFSEGALVSPLLLSWYTRDALNYGVDFSLFDDRMIGGFDYFYYVTKGGLMSPSDRYTTPLGTTLPQIKSDSEHRREGVEFSLRWSDKIAKEFTYEVGVNMTYFNNLWKKKADESLNSLMNPWKRTTNQSDYFANRLLDEGLFQSPEQILSSPRRPQSTETKMGDIAYRDVNGDGKIDSEDEVRVGNPSMPHFTYGVDFSFGYKGFSLSGLLYGTGHRNMEFGIAYKYGEASQLRNPQQLDYWKEDNINARLPRLSNIANVNGTNNQANSTFWMENAQFLRLKNLSIGYDFKHQLLKKETWLSMCRINLSGANLLTFSKVNKYFDPETASVNGQGYPVQRVYSIGLTIGF